MRLRIPINDGIANAGGMNGPPMGVQVHIPAALNRPTHTLYSICMSVQPTLQEWTVNRRYSQFLTLRTDMISALVNRRPCPACSSFALALRRFPFPRKAWLRSNRIVRKRVKALEAFLQLIVERLFNNLPKCGNCGDHIKKMVRPFLIRGAQPLGDSTLSKIQHSLSLQSFAVVKHRPRHVDLATSPTEVEITRKKAPVFNTNNVSYATTMRTTVDPSMDDDTTCEDSPTQQSVDFAASTRSEESYGKQFDIEPRCTDTPVALEEALKQVVINGKRKNTVEELTFRLTTMWDAYSLDETLAAVPQQLGMRLSQTFQEEGSEDGMGVSDRGPKDTSSPESSRYEEGEMFDEDDDVIHMLEAEPEDENNTSFAVLQDDYVFDEEAEDARETLPVDTVSYAF